MSPDIPGSAQEGTRTSGWGPRRVGGFCARQSWPSHGRTAEDAGEKETARRV